MATHDTGIDNWIDYLIKRWPLVLAVSILVVGVLKTQWVQNAQAREMEKINISIDSLSDIRAEWPYLKEKVSNIDKKVDILLSRSN